MYSIKSQTIKNTTIIDKNEIIFLYKIRIFAQFARAAYKSGCSVEDIIYKLKNQGICKG